MSDKLDFMSEGVTALSRPFIIKAQRTFTFVHLFSTYFVADAH